MISKIRPAIIEKADGYIPLLLSFTIITFFVGLYFSLIESPADYIQGDSMRIMYIHVPSAWFSLMIYTLIALSSVFWFILRNPLLSLAGRSLAPIGAMFTFLALITGSIWGKPTWGTWWAWDARLTSMLILFFLYLAYILLWHSISNKDNASKIAAALGIIGFINIPIIKFSVDWWNTLHQPASVIRASGPSINIEMLIPLMIMSTGVLLLFFYLIFTNIQSAIAEKKILFLSSKD